MRWMDLEILWGEYYEVNGLWNKNIETQPFGTVVDSFQIKDSIDIPKLDRLVIFNHSPWHTVDVVSCWNRASTFNPVRKY